MGKCYAPTTFSMEYDPLARGCVGACGNAGSGDNVGRGVAFAAVDAAWFVLIRPFEIKMASIYWRKCYAPTGLSRCKDLSSCGPWFAKRCVTRIEALIVAQNILPPDL